MEARDRVAPYSGVETTFDVYVSPSLAPSSAAAGVSLSCRHDDTIEYADRGNGFQSEARFRSYVYTSSVSGLVSTRYSTRSIRDRNN